MAGSLDVLVVGSYVQDHAWLTDRFPVPGETRVGQFSTGPGGKGFNQAVAAHRLGARTCFVGATGEDALAAHATRFAEEIGLPCRFLRTELPTAASSIVVDASGQNLIVVALGANLALDGERVGACLDAMPVPKVLLVQHEIAPDGSLAALRWARARGARAVLNPAPALPAWSSRLLPEADLITPNETEFAALVAMLPDAPAEMPWHDDRALFELARRLPTGDVLITLGEAGALLCARDATAPVRVPAPRVAARDCTGAGDALTGALVAALSAGASLAGAVRLAVHAAALACEAVGTATAMVDRATLDRRFPELAEA